MSLLKNKKLVTIFLSPLLGAFLLPQISWAQKQAIQLSDILKVSKISNLELHPSTDQLLYSVRKIIPDTSKKEEYRYKDEIYKLDLRKKGLATAIQSTTDGNVSQARFSPSGKQLVVVQSVNGKPQLFTQTGNEKPQPLTAFKYGASNPIWTNDGKALIFSATVDLTDILTDTLLQNKGEPYPIWASEKPAIDWQQYLVTPGTAANLDGNINEIRAYLQGNAERKKAKVIDKLQFQTESFTTGDLKFNHYFIIQLDNPTLIRPLARGYRSYANAFTDANDGLFLNVREGTKHPDRNNTNAIYRLDIKKNQWERLLYDGEHQFTLLDVDKKHKQLSYLKQKPNTLTYPELYISDYNPSLQLPTLIAIDNPKENVHFDPNNGDLWLTVVVDGQRDLYHYDKKKKTLQNFRKENTGVQDFIPYKDQLIQLISTTENPYEIYLTDRKNKQQEALTQENSNWLSQRHILPVSKIELQNEQGASYSYWLIKPEVKTSTNATPLLVEIHGGPASYFGPDDASMWLEYQYFAAKGYAVLYGNPRGSTGYGLHFLKANFQDWGNGPARDVLHAVDKVIADNKSIDPNNLFLTGGSYGGYLTTWILANDQRFRAASSQRGVYDLKTFFGEGNVWPMVKRYFGGNPWEGDTDDVLRNNSVLEIAHQIQTPLLIFHGEQDLRTGIAQSERLYKTLKVLEKPVEYVRHPGANHEITRSGDVTQRIDQLLRTYEFFERYNTTDQ